MRRQIMALVVGLTTLVILAFAIPVGFLIQSAVVASAERAAVQQANNLALVARNGTSSELQASLNLLPQDADHRSSVQLSNGTVLGKLPPASDQAQSYPGDQVPPPEQVPNRNGRPGPLPGGPGGEQAQLRQVPGGEVAQLAVRTSSGEIGLVQVYVSDAALHSGVVRWLLLLGGGCIALLLLSALGAELLTRRIVRPLVQTAETAHQLTAGDVTARAPTNGPREVAEVGSSLNQLADRIDELVAEERETVANLSHRMRTPLTALRLESESLRDPAERERIATQASALERTLTAVIHAARRPQREGRLPAADATAVVGDRVAFWSALTDEQERACTLTLPDGPLIVRASAEDLAAAVDALIENVVAHTPEGTPFAVSLRSAPPNSSTSWGSSSSVDLSPTDSLVPDAPPSLDPAAVRAYRPGSTARPARSNAVLSPGSAVNPPLPSGGASAFTPRLSSLSGLTELTVSDAGPGLPDGAGIRGRSDRGSSGLGLSIARRCAQASGGWMDTGRSPTGGAQVTLYLGAP
jgi:signal transduction histidine kinase